MIDPVNSYVCMGTKEMRTEFCLGNLQKRDDQEDHHNIKNETSLNVVIRCVNFKVTQFTA